MALSETDVVRRVTFKVSFSYMDVHKRETGKEKEGTALYVIQFWMPCAKMCLELSITLEKCNIEFQKGICTPKSSYKIQFVRDFK